MSKVDGAGRGQCPHTMVDVTRYEDVTAVWRSPDTSVKIAAKGEEHYHRGTVTRLDGEEHLRRRKALGQLLARRGHASYREKWLYPVANQAIEDLLANPKPEGVSIEVVKWGRRISQQLAAALAGYDGGTSPEGADRLFELSQQMIAGRPSLLKVIMGEVDEDAPAHKAGLMAKAEIIEAFHNPAVRRRQELLQQVEAGSLDAAQLPSDFLMLAAQKVDPAWSDPGQTERDALLLLGAAVHTTTNSLVWALQEIFEWADRQPDRALDLTDENFILRAAQESLRLHPVVPALSRRLTKKLDLPSGAELAEGTVALLRSGPASADPDVFGPDAREFNPDREPPKKLSRFGLAFGQGAHMCFGMPLVIGTGGVDGSLVYLLKLLLAAGAQPDNAKNAAFDLDACRGQFGVSRTEYHLLLGRESKKQAVVGNAATAAVESA
jgi:cytochrome P450